MPTAALVSFRLGGTDGVSVESAKWAGALGRLGWQVVTVAGAGTAARLLPGLAMDAAEAPATAEVADALADADLVVVENLCSLPLNPAAAAAVATVCAGRPAVLHHHDLAGQRPQFAGAPPPPDDPAWRHVTINERSRLELGALGIEAVTLYNTFDPEPAGGDRPGTRRALGLDDGDRLVLQPTRALDRKNVGGGIALAEALGATYWLLGPAEDGYERELARLLGAARCPVRHGPVHRRNGTAPGVGDAYAACDVVTLPSWWEGFGNPAIESAVERRPLAVGPYPVAVELARFGFEWFAHDRPVPLATWLDRGDRALLERNHRRAAAHFNLADLPARLARLLDGMDVAGPSAQVASANGQRARGGHVARRG